jgi:hypothetical protein
MPDGKRVKPIDEGRDHRIDLATLFIAGVDAAKSAVDDVPRMLLDLARVAAPVPVGMSVTMPPPRLPAASGEGRRRDGGEADAQGRAPGEIAPFGVSAVSILAHGKSLLSTFRYAHR